MMPRFLLLLPVVLGKVQPVSRAAVATAGASSVGVLGVVAVLYLRQVFNGKYQVVIVRVHLAFSLSIRHHSALCPAAIW